MREFSEACISGGDISRFSTSGGAGPIQVSGGSFGNFQANNSDVEIIGAEFRLNNTEFTQPIIDLNDTDVFSGTLSDGSAFIFAAPVNSFLGDELDGVALTTTTVPDFSLEPIVVDSDNPVGPQGLRSGQTLTLREGGTLNDNFAVLPDAALHIEGGIMGERGKVAFAEVNITGGRIGQNFVASCGSNVSIHGGVIDGHFQGNPGSNISVTGAAFHTRNCFSIHQNSIVTISGGSFGTDFEANPGSQVELIGGEFLLNNSPFLDTSITLNEGNDVFSGTLSDGSTFIFTTEDTDRLEDVTLTTVALPPIDQTPIVVDAANPLGPQGLRTGQHLTLRDGGILGENFTVLPDAVLNIEGGIVKFGAEAVGADISISGGQIESFRANLGSYVQISGGSFVYGFRARENCVVSVSGGEFLLFYEAGTNNSISGGIFHGSFLVRENENADISGGEFLGGLTASADGAVNLFGTLFFIDGMLVDLKENEQLTILERDVVVTGNFADGSDFEFDLASNLISPDATLTITRVPEILLGDVNLDGLVSLLDVAPFVDLLTSGDFQLEADLNMDGVLDLLDIAPFVELLQGA